MHIALFVMYFLVPLLYILRAAMFPQRAMSMPYRTLTVCVLMKKKIVSFINKVFSLKSSTRSQVYQQDVWCRYDFCLLLQVKNFGCGTGGWTLAMKTNGTEVYTLH